MNIAIEFNLTKKELFSFTFSQAFTRWKRILIVSVMTTFAFWLISEELRGWSSSWIFLLYFVFMLVFLFGIQFLMGLYSLFVTNRKIVSKLFSIQKFVATEETALFQLGGSSSKTLWSDFFKISYDRKFLLLWINSVNVKIIPWRFFSDEERATMSEFINKRPNSKN